MDNQELDFRPIPDWPRYWITEDGSVWSTYTPRDAPPRWKKMTAWQISGYPAVAFKMKGKGRKSAYVHDLLLRTFVGPPAKGQQARHLDGEKTHSWLSNLAWGTRHENMADCVLHGTDQRGMKHHNVKLTTQEVLEIRASAEKTRILAERYKVSAGHIRDIRHLRERVYG